MKILHINTLYPPHIGGGAEVTLRSIVNALSVRGHSVSVLTTHGGTQATQDCVDHIDITRVPVKNIYWHFDRDSKPAWMHAVWHAIDSYNPWMAKAVSQAIKSLQPDVISCHNLPGFSCSVWGAAARAGVPIVQVLHDFYALCPKSTCFRNDRVCKSPCTFCAALRMPHSRASANVSAVVGVSAAVLNAHLERGLFANAKVREVIHDAQALSAASPRADRTSAGLVFGYIGGLLKVKGVELLLESFEDLRERTAPNAILLLAGSGEAAYVASLRRRFENEHVRFVGHSKPEEFFAQLDVSVVPSLWEEPLGRVVFESMHFGVPVIGARRGGIPEMLQHEVNGLLFEPLSHGSLVEALARVHGDEKLLKSMKAVAPGSVSRFVDEDRMIDEYVDVLQRVVYA